MKNNKGISLIVLVITIIVMIILAGAIILTLNNSGIISNANEAVNLSNEAQLKQIAQTYYAKYIIEGPNETANEYVKSEMRAAGIDEKYVERIIVYDDGKTIVGASKIAVKLFEAKVPVGTKVSGYDISGNEVKSYTTDGKELETKTSEKNPQTVNVAKEVSWTYMGISDEGEALIVLDLDNTSVEDADASGVYSTMALGGPGGYLYGEDVLNTVCEKLYSTSKGKARSINYEDILAGLRYNGPIAQYTDTTGKTVSLHTIFTMGELMTMVTKYISSSSTPDSRDLSSFKVDSIKINVKTQNGEPDSFAQYVNANSVDVETVLGKYDINYWIADNCVAVDFSYGNVGKVFFNIRRGNCKGISYYMMTTTAGSDIYRISGETGKVVLRPVVELADELTFSYANHTLTLN